MAVLSRLRANQESSSKTWSWNIIRNSLSMVSAKKFAMLGVVFMAVVAIVVGSGPLLTKLGVIKNNQNVVSAHELLRLTREQAEKLSPEEKKELTKNIQGNLEDIWVEAEAATDLQFLTGREYWAMYFKDMQTYLKLDLPPNVTIDDMIKEMQKTNQGEKAFRYTDPQGKVTYLSIVSVPNSGGNQILLSHAVMMVVKYGDKDTYVSTGNDQACETVDKGTLQSFLVKRLKQKFPEVAVQYDEHGKNDFRLLNGRDQIEEFKNLPRYLNVSPDFKDVETLVSDDPLSVDTSHPDGYMLFMGFSGKNGKKYVVAQLLRCADYTKIVGPLLVHHKK
jgi:hypothetical protein